MSPRLLQAALGGFLLVGLLGIAACATETCAKKTDSYIEEQAHAAKVEASTHEAEAKAKDAQIPDLQAKLNTAKADLDRVSAQRNALLLQLSQQTSGGHVALPDTAPEPTHAPDVRDEVIAKDAEVIAAQKNVISQQDTQILVLTGSRDQWKAAYESEKRANVGLQISLDAQKTVSKSSKWLGRIEGFAIGFGVGYLGGRVR